MATLCYQFTYFFLVIHDAIVFGGRAAIKSRLSRAGRMNRLTRRRGRHPNIFQFHLSIRPIGLLIGKPKSWIAAHVSTYYRTSTEEEADVMHARPGHVIQSSFRYNGFVMLDTQIIGTLVVR